MHQLLEQINEPYTSYRITEKGRQLLQLFNHNGADVLDYQERKNIQAKTTLQGTRKVVTNFDLRGTVDY